MNETHPPRFAEAMLESFGADLDFSDAIIGDLAQEHAQRVDRHGATAARLWYYRQAVFACPALMRNWFSGAHWSDARRLLNVVGLAYVVTMMVEVGTTFGIAAVISPFVSRPAILGTTAGQLALGVVLAAFGPLCAGYLAANFEEKRPMIGAAAVGFAWTGFLVTGTVISTMLSAPSPGFDIRLFLAMRLTIIPAIVLCSLIGGALRVRVVSGRPAAAGPSNRS